MERSKWTATELKVLERNRNCTITYIRKLLPHRSYGSINQRMKRIKRKARLEEEMHKLIPTPHKLAMEEGKTYRLSRKIMGNDGRCSTKYIKVRVIKILHDFVLFEHKAGYKECFQRVDLGRIIHYKEVG